MAGRARRGHGVPFATMARGLQTATGVVEVASAAAPASGKVLTATSATTATWQTPSGGAPTGSAGGDLSGTYPNPGVAKVAGVTPSAYVLTLLDDADAATARGTLALGTVATLALDTDGTLAANSDANVATQKAVKTYADAGYRPSGTDVAVADGGTGASTAATARTNLGLAIGSDVQAYSAYLTAMAGASQSITADTTLTTQRSILNVNGSWAVTLPAISGWTLGVPTIVEYHGTTSATIQVIANASDKIEGADRVWLTGKDIYVVIVPFAANKISVETTRGETYIPLLQTPLTGSTLTQTNAISGSTLTYSTALTDTGSTTTAAAGGFAQVGKTGSTFTGAATSSCAIVSGSFASVTDAWGRVPVIGQDVLFIAARGSQTAAPSGTQINSWVGVVGSAKGSVVRGGASGSSASGNLICAYRDGISSKSVELPASAASVNTQWLGFALDTRNKTMSRAMLTTAATPTAGVCGKDFCPADYLSAELATFGQDCTTGSGLWLSNGMVGFAMAATCTTTGRTFTWDYATLMKIQVGST